VARIAKFVLGAVAAGVIALGAFVVAREAGLLAGSLVVLAALIALTLASRMIAAREERSAMADWEEVLEKDAPADAFFSDWTTTVPRTGRITPARADDELALSAHTAAGLESLDDLAPADDPVAGAVPATDEWSEPAALTDDTTGVADQDEAPEGSEPLVGLAGSGIPVAPAGDDTHGFPFDDPYDGFGDLPPFPGRPDHDADLPPIVAAPFDPPRPEPLPHVAMEELHLGSPAADIDRPPPGGFGPDAAPVEADAFSFAGSVAGANGARRSLIDWSGPVHSVDEQVRTSDDILKASAATALPTAEVDRPAPAGGSELARLLAKVEERLREYD
jgi:hypothetical protein